MTEDKKADVFGGSFYYRDATGKFVRIGEQLGDVTVNAWICRRVVDFPNGLPPVGAVIGACSRCQARIAYNPGRVASVPLDTPQICMQCAHVAPLPIEP